jgi:hypothetical protein
MSWTRLPESALVLTPHGWTMVGTIGSEAVLLGLDRSGRPATSMVLTEHRGSVRPVFLGTRSTAGWVAPETRIVTDRGPVIARDLVDGDVREARFETHMTLGDTAAAFSIVWALMSRVARLVTNRIMVVPWRSRLTVIAAPWVRTVKRFDRPYAVVSKESFERAMSADWAKTMLDLRPAVLYRCSEMGHTCSTESVHLLPWILSALCSTETAYMLAFDTLQFSSYVDVLVGRGPLEPFERGACAFMSAEEEREIAVLWYGSSWNPIVAGFIAASGPA